MRYASLFAALGGLALASCGGGGGGGGFGGSAATSSAIASSSLLPAYDFTVTDAGSSQDRLVAQSDFGGGRLVDVEIDFRIEPTIGRYDFATRTVVFEDGAIAVEGDFGPMVVDIVEPLELAPGEPPSDVAIEVTIGLFIGLVRVRFSSGRVELELGSAAPVIMTFAEFEDLLLQQTTAPVWQHQTALGWAALDLLRHLVTLQADAVAMIDTNLESTAVRDRMCDAFPGAPLPGALAQGMSRLTWLGSGRIGNGDDFAWDFTSCWLDAAGSRGILLDGRAHLRGLSTSIAAGTLRRIGFQGSTALGGLLFDDLDLTATIRSGSTSVTASPEASFVLSRGVRIFFDAPQ